MSPNQYIIYNADMQAWLDNRGIFTQTRNDARCFASVNAANDAIDSVAGRYKGATLRVVIK